MNCDFRLPPTLTKHLLFYSKYCQFSTEILDLIRKYNKRSIFMCICVEDYDVPSFVDCVPMIVTTDSRILKDNLVFEFVTPQSRGGSSFGEFQAASEFSNDMSDRYSFVEDISLTNTNNTKRFLSLDMLGSNGEFPIICTDLEGVSIEQQQQHLHQKTKRTLRDEASAPPLVIPNMTVPSVTPYPYPSSAPSHSSDKDKVLEQIMLERETEIQQYQPREATDPQS